jgi:hypothetical protein
MAQQVREIMTRAPVAVEALTSVEAVLSLCLDCARRRCRSGASCCHTQSSGDGHAFGPSGRGAAPVRLSQ